MDKFVYIILGAVVGILVVLILMCCLCCKKRKNTEPTHENSGDTKSSSQIESLSASSGNGEVAILRSTEDSSPAHTVYNIEERSANYREENNPTEAKPSNKKEDLRFSKTSNPADHQGDSPVNNMQLSGTRNDGNLKSSTVAYELATYRVNSSPDNKLQLQVKAYESTKVSDDGRTDQDTTSPKDNRLGDMVSSGFRDELNLILRKDSPNSPKLMTDGSSVYPSQLKEYTSSSVKYDSQAKSEVKKINPGPASPNIPQPDYGVLPSHPLPYKRRDFKGPYGADDLDDMNNPYTMKKRKTERRSIN